MSGGPDEDNIFQWKASIAGPKTTPFEVNHNDGIGTQLVSLLKTLSFLGRNSVRDIMEGNANCRCLQKLTFKRTLRDVIIRVFRLETQSVMLVFLTQLYELLTL